MRRNATVRFRDGVIHVLDSTHKIAVTHIVMTFPVIKSPIKVINDFLKVHDSLCAELPGESHDSDTRRRLSRDGVQQRTSLLLGDGACVDDGRHRIARKNRDIECSRNDGLAFANDAVSGERQLT